MKEITELRLIILFSQDIEQLCILSKSVSQTNKIHLLFIYNKHDSMLFSMRLQIAKNFEF